MRDYCYTCGTRGTVFVCIHPVTGRAVRVCETCEERWSELPERRRGKKGETMNVLAARVAIKERVELLDAMERVSSAVCTADTTGYTTCRLCGCAQYKEAADHFPECPIETVRNTILERATR